MEKESLLFAFRALSRGTFAEGAEIEIISPPLLLYCPECENEYTAAGIEDLGCPVCGGEDFDIISGREMTIKSIAGETHDGTS